MKGAGYQILRRASERLDEARIAEGRDGKTQAEAALFVKLKTTALREGSR